MDILFEGWVQWQKVLRCHGRHSVLPADNQPLWSLPWSSASSPCTQYKMQVVIRVASKHMSWTEDHGSEELRVRDSESDRCVTYWSCDQTPSNDLEITPNGCLFVLVALVHTLNLGPTQVLMRFRARHPSWLHSRKPPPSAYFQEN